MGRKKRSQKEKELRRGDIIDAAERVFFSKGYENASMDEVAKEAEFSKRTVYMYFSGKEQIYYEIMIRGYRLLIDMLEAGFEEKKPQNAVEELRCIFFSFFRFSQEHAAYFKAIMEYETRDSDQCAGLKDTLIEECYQLGEQIFDYLSRALQKGIQEGSLRKGLDSEKAALILWACTVGVFNTREKKKEYLRNYHSINPEEFVTEAFDMMMHLIADKGETENERKKNS